MQCCPYLAFDGQCADAFALYQKVFGGEIPFKVTFGETPMAAQCAPEARDRIAHMRLQAGDLLLMGSDSPPGQFRQPQGFNVAVAPATVAEAERIFNGLAEGGTVIMPGQKTFWAAYFGMVTDRFGTPWMINCEAAQT